MNAIAGCRGFSLGYQFAIEKNHENEIKQGKNYYLASVSQGIEAILLSESINQCSLSIFKNSTFLIGFRSQLAIYSVCFGFSTLFASVRQGNYEGIAKRIDSCLVPKEFSERTVRVFSFFSENIGNLYTAAFICSAIALSVFGDPFFGVAMLAAMVYQQLDSNGFIPRKLSLFVETYMPAVSSVFFICFSLSYLNRILGLLMLMNEIKPVARFLQHRAADIGTFFISSKIPSLGELEKDFIEPEDLSKREIERLLKNEFVRYEMNPAHCSIKNPIKLPEDYQFEAMLDIYDKVVWEYKLLKGKLQSDERFQDYLSVQFPETKRENLALEFDVLIDQLRGSQTREQFLQQHIRKDLESLIAVLKGKERVQGRQKQLDQVIPQYAQILHHLKQLEGDSERISRESILLRLGVEAGDYCAVGLVRAAKEILKENVLPTFMLSDFTPLKQKKMTILEALASERIRLFDLSIDEWKTSPRVPELIAPMLTDMHVYEPLKAKFFLGFVPIDEDVRDQASVFDFIACQNIFSKSIQPVFHQYKRNMTQVVINSITASELAPTAVQLIEDNQKLSQKEKQELMDQINFTSESMWFSPEEYNERIAQFILVAMGVLRPKKGS